MHRCKAYARVALVVMTGGLLALLTSVHETTSSIPVPDWEVPMPKRVGRLSQRPGLEVHQVLPPAVAVPAHCGTGWDSDVTNPAVWRRTARRPVTDLKQATLASDKACALQRKVTELWGQRWHISVPPSRTEELLQRWPLCFQAQPQTNATKADLRRLLNDTGWRTEVSALRTDTGPLWLNALNLALNLALRPAVYHIPILITTVERNANKLQQTLAFLGRVDSIALGTVVLAIEGFSLPFFEAIAKELSYAYARLLFVPISKCFRHRPSKSDDDGKDFRINLSFLWAMHFLMLLVGYPYVALLEDDMAPGPDFYLHHLALSVVPLADPSVVAVMASNAGMYYDCHGLLRTHLAGLPSQYDAGEMNVVYYAAEIMPWGAGYTLPIVLDMLQWYLWNELTGPYHRYDIIMNRVLGPHRYSLFPLAWRIHGDPKHYSPLRRLLPALRSCDHETYRIVWPPGRTGILRPSPSPSPNVHSNVTVLGLVTSAGRTFAAGRAWDAHVAGLAFVLGDARWQLGSGAPFSLAIDPTAAYHRVAPELVVELERLCTTRWPRLLPEHLLCPDEQPASPSAALFRQQCWLRAAHLSALPDGHLCLHLPPSRGANASSTPSCTLCLTLRELLVYGMHRGTPVYAFAFQRAYVTGLVLGAPFFAIGFPVHFGPADGAHNRTVVVGDGSRHLCTSAP